MDKLNFATIGVNIGDKGKADEIATPMNICNDMVELFPKESFENNKVIWADIYCKTGNTLKALKQHGVSKENIIAICPTPQSQLFACRQLYGKLLPEVKIDRKNKYPDVAGVFDITRRGQVYYISNWKEIVKGKVSNTNTFAIINKIILKEMRSEMSLEFTSEDSLKINNIIMNPPYNNDAYLDFVTLAHNLVTDNVVAITPAKWQAKAGQKNEQFRHEIVPYMSKIVYYPYCIDIFDITCHGGITYYLIDKQKHNNSKLSVRHKNESVFIQDCDTQYSNKAYSLYGDFIEEFIGKIINGNRHHLYVNRKLDGMYKCKILHVYSGNLSGLNCIGGMIITPIEINMTNDIKSDHYVIYSGKMEECESFKSYLYTKFVRFCLALGVHTQHFNNDEAWRFVPDPGAFDHIFTDQELYKKYNLTDEEINIIESVIKERK